MPFWISDDWAYTIPLLAARTSSGRKGVACVGDHDSPLSVLTDIPAVVPAYRVQGTASSTTTFPF